MPFGTAQALPGSAPCGARTFLEYFRTRDRPADNIHMQDNSASGIRYDADVTMME